MFKDERILQQSDLNMNFMTWIRSEGKTVIIGVEKPQILIGLPTVPSYHPSSNTLR